jgi:Icc-related predicted phosphoesterase
MADAPRRVRIAAVGDLHCGLGGGGAFKALFAQVPERADVLVLCGDLTDFGLPDEARELSRELALLKLPILAVLGNHDFESGQQDEVSKILAGSGVIVLNGQAHEVLGVGFAGTKGFGGGFGIRSLEPWGEQAVKLFVQEALDETLKLGMALSRLRTTRRIVLLHYSPIQATVEGEPPEIFCYLGSSRLEEPLNRYGVTAVFHGHAHRGKKEGQTRDGIPVYNVSLPLLRSTPTDQPSVKVVEISIDAVVSDSERPSSF